MDTSTAIIGSLMIIACLIPFILSGTSRKSIEKQLKKSLFDIAQKHHLALTESDFWFKTGIGINTESNTLLFYKLTKEAEITHILKLNEYKSCKINRVNDNSQHIELLQLVLSSKSQTKPDEILEFFNAEFSPQLNMEVKLIDKWQKTINQAINNSISYKKAV